MKNKNNTPASAEDKQVDIIIAVLIALAMLALIGAIWDSYIQHSIEMPKLKLFDEDKQPSEQVQGLINTTNK
jgi:hypothetical protein